MLKLSVFKSARLEATRDPVIYASVCRALRPESAYHASATAFNLVALLNKLAEATFDKLSEQVLSAIESGGISADEAAKQILVHAVRQPSGAPLFAKLFGHVVDGWPASAQAAETFAEQAAEECAALATVELPPDDQYDAFCDATKRKAQIAATGRVLGILRVGGRLSLEKTGPFLESVFSAAQSAAPFGLEAIVEAAAAMASEDAVLRKEVISKSEALLGSLKSVPFKLRFKIEKSITELKKLR
jgi:hypothetical protein